MRIYFLLSAVKYLKKHNGLWPTPSFTSFITNSYSRRKTAEEAAPFVEEILDTLISENIVEIVDDQVILVDA